MKEYWSKVALWGVNASHEVVYVLEYLNSFLRIPHSNCGEASRQKVTEIQAVWNLCRKDL